VLTRYQVAQWDNQRHKLRIGGHRKRVPFEEDSVFVHWPHGRFFIRGTRREPSLILESFDPRYPLLMRPKDGRRGRIRHSWFREVPRQISSPFVLPFARCQPMNSVCLGRRAHRRVCVCVCVCVCAELFPRRVFQSGSVRRSSRKASSG